MQEQKELILLLLAVKMKEGWLQAEENGLPCEAKNSSQLTARREMGPHNHNHNKLNFASKKGTQLC